MISIKEINMKDVELCFALDSNNISLWSKKQWDEEFKKEGIKVFGVLRTNLIIGICVIHVVIDEAQINYFVVDQHFRRLGYGSYLMNYLIKQCKNLSIKKLFLEVSDSNLDAQNFYSQFDFFTFGIRKNYYKDGSNALLKAKKFIKK